MSVSPRDVEIINVSSNSFKYDYVLRVKINGKYYSGALELSE